MGNYRLKVTVKNSAGNELVKAFNFTTVEEMEYPQMYITFYALVKDGYHLEISSGHKRPSKNLPLSFEKLCVAIKEWRFYETKSTAHYETNHTWKYKMSLNFPCEVDLHCFNSEWGGTYFEITMDEKTLVNADFDSIKAAFEKHGLDLHKSKTDGLWYSHSFLELTALHNSILIRERITSYNWVYKEERTEL